jgi:ubiquinone biosynthesis protein
MNRWPARRFRCRRQIVDEFWTFFHELMSDPELRGLADLGLDITRLILKTYEPLLVEVINELKDIYYSNQNRHGRCCCAACRWCAAT